MRMIRRVVVVAASLVLAACNPLTFDPQVSYPGFEVGRVTVTADDPVWIEGAVTGTDGYVIYALALVHDEERTGPTDRSCVVAGDVEPCLDTLSDVRTPTQTVLTADGSRGRLMTVWPEEDVEIWLVCIDEATEDLACPDSLRLKVRTTDEAGNPVGDISLAG